VETDDPFPARQDKVTRSLSILALVLVALTTAARADDVQDARDAYNKGQFKHARELLLRAYDADPQPQILFALGQVEFNLGHYREAIDYYTRFNATNPPADQAALAQQAIGAARARLDTPPPPPPPKVKPPPPPPPPHREWDRLDSVLAISGGVAVLGGGGLIATAMVLGGNHTGTLQAYDQRLEHAHDARLAGIGLASAGALAIAGAVLRWRFDLVVDASPTRVGIAWEHPL
jgi:tetratricopeptide (TPR) repeat protein